MAIRAAIAAVCVYPALVPVTKATLEKDGVNIAAVSACFPSSQTFIEAKVAEVAPPVTRDSTNAPNAFKPWH